MTPDFDQPTAPVPLDDIAAIHDQLDEGRRVMSDITRRLDDHDRGQVEILKQLGAQAQAMAANTEITTQIRDLWAAGKVGTKLIVWVGSVAGGLSGVIALWLAWPKK